MKKLIAAISMVRNDSFFADKWISYYGKHLGFENLYLFIDGMDQPLPKQASKINCFQIQHQNLNRTEGDRHRAKKISEFACKLYPKYHSVLAMDIDEFLIVDPKISFSLKTYLQQDFKSASCSALGLDVAQHPGLEKAIDLKSPFLSQRKFAKISDRYTKPIVSFKPLKWGSGFHRIKGKNYKIDSNLFLFHFGLVDLKSAKNKSDLTEFSNQGWRGHLNRRFKLYKTMEKETAQEGDFLFDKARDFLNRKRKWYSWNKPAPLKGESLIIIPKRFQTLV